MLRDYQLKGVNDIRQAIRDGFKSILYVLPTGGGKTVIFNYLSAQTSSKGKRSKILVHRQELLKQTVSKLEKDGLNVGVIAANKKPNPFASIQVASVQTLIRRMNKLNMSYDVVIIDEAHHVGAKTWDTIIQELRFVNPNIIILGFTATPIRTDGKGLGVGAGGIFETIVLGPTIKELINMGFLVKPVVFGSQTRVDKAKLKRGSDGDYTDKSIEAAMNSKQITGSAVAQYTKLCPGVPCVVFCATVKHAKDVASEFEAAGYRATYVDGELDDDERADRLDGLGNGKYQVVTSCNLISEGTDIPAIECAILLRITQSEALYLQMVGRALRLNGDKQMAYILDHGDNWAIHGTPDAEREWSLDGVKSRIKAEKEKTVKAVMCLGCLATFAPAPVCPHCGLERKQDPKELEVVDGDLVAIDEAAMEAVKRQKKMEVWNAKTFQEFKEIEVRRGYKNGWAATQWNIRQSKKRGTDMPLFS
jgi:DNA repair protein RadD